MKKILLSLLLSFTFGYFAYGQCTPGDATSCPDPENNGEICPDTFATATLGMAYSQTVTILPPPSYDYNGNNVPIEKIQIKKIENLPTGLNWTSNATNHIFNAGTYYCILIDGTPSDTGNFSIKVTVEAWVNVFGNIISAGEVVDSTSMYMYVNPQVGVAELRTKAGFKVHPNPFTNSLQLDIPALNEELEFEIFDISGKSMLKKQFGKSSGKSSVKLNDIQLPPGMYIYRLRGKSISKMGKLIRHQ